MNQAALLQQEIVASALEDVRRGTKGWQGVIPVRLVNVESVDLLGTGVHALVTVELPDGAASWQFVLSPEDAREAARRLAPIGDHARSGLFVVGT